MTTIDEILNVAAIHRSTPQFRRTEWGIETEGRLERELVLTEVDYDTEVDHDIESDSYHLGRWLGTWDKVTGKLIDGPGDIPHGLHGPDGHEMHEELDTDAVGPFVKITSLRNGMSFTFRKEQFVGFERAQKSAPSTPNVLITWASGDGTEWSTWTPEGDDAAFMMVDPTNRTVFWLYEYNWYDEYGMHLGVEYDEKGEVKS